MSEKISNFLAEKRRDTPLLVLDLDLVVDRYRRLKETLPNVDIYYAIKDYGKSAEILERGIELQPKTK